MEKLSEADAKRETISSSNSDAQILSDFQLVRNDPWEFAVRHVNTKDEVDPANPIKRFPAHQEYLKLYFKLWVREHFIAVPKSRRMFMTWSNLILYLWDTMFHIGRNNAIVSKKEDDSDDLIKRAVFILKNLEGLPPDLVPEWKYKYCELSFPQIESKIMGFPSGADQLRQFTFSGILADEMAFWDNAQEMYSASFPTLEGGGRFTAISSPGPGFFKSLVFDQLDVR